MGVMTTKFTKQQLQEMIKGIIKENFSNDELTNMFEPMTPSERFKDELQDEIMKGVRKFLYDYYVESNDDDADAFLSDIERKEKYHNKLDELETIIVDAMMNFKL